MRNLKQFRLRKYSFPLPVPFARPGFPPPGGVAHASKLSFLRFSPSGPPGADSLPPLPLIFGLQLA
jgi:hypothetical protein